MAPAKGGLLAPPFSGLVFFVFFQRVIGLFLGLPNQLGQLLAAQSVVDEENNQQHDADAEDVEQAS